jgi:hypothetical protein
MDKLEYAPSLPHFGDVLDLSLDTDIQWANRDALISPHSAFIGTHPFVEEEEDTEAKEEKEEVLLDTNTKLERALAENKSLVFKLYRRAGVIQEIKDAYLRDIIVMKNAMAEHLNKAGAQEVVALWNDSLPSIDLSKALALHAPTLSELKVKPCKNCGGSLDIEFHDSEKYNRIYAKVVKISGRNEELRLALATQAAQYDAVQAKVHEQRQEHEQEVRRSAVVGLLCVSPLLSVAMIIAHIALISGVCPVEKVSV